MKTVKLKDGSTTSDTLASWMMFHIRRLRDEQLTAFIELLNFCKTGAPISAESMNLLIRGWGVADEKGELYPGVKNFMLCAIDEIKDGENIKWEIIDPIDRTEEERELAEYLANRKEKDDTAQENKN